MKKTVIEKITALLNLYGIPENLLSRAFGAYFAVSAFQLISARRQDIDTIASWKDYVNAYPLVLKLLWVAVLFAWLSAIYRFAPKKYRSIDHAVLIGGSIFFALCLVWRSGSFYLGLAAAAVAVVFSVYALGKLDNNSFERLPDLPAGVIVFASAAAVALFVAVSTSASHRNFGTSCFDMGIFVQMFHSLKEHFTAVTTCERDELMSHFRVHGSFIFYLILPVYAIFPKGETLLWIQAVFAIAGVLPLYLIAKRRGFKGFALVSICLIYVFFDGLVMPCYYAFHENALLPTILMWLLYAADRRNIPLFYIMSALTCIVKEDAPLYVICIALYLLIDEKSKVRVHGAVAAGLSGIYFLLITKWLNENGDGLYMTSSRLGSLMSDPDAGFGGMLGNVISHPGYFFSLFVTENTLLFFVQTMLPLLFLPFFTKKLHRFILMIPYVIMNLVIGANYGYAANIGFQYIFGPSCLLIYMTLLNLEDIPRERRNALVMAAATVATVTTFSMMTAKLSVIEHNRDRRDYFESAENCIQTVPKDASVLANTFLLPHCADRDEVYELDNGCFTLDDDGNVIALIGFEKYDFCVFSLHDPLTEKLRPLLEKSGWTLYSESDGFVVVFVSDEYISQH